MLTPCRFIYPYYNNPEMLALQVENWSRIEGELREAVQIIVIDDHSKEAPTKILESCKAPVRAYRLAADWPWNMHEARNIGAKVACKSRENMWMFMSDIDIVITPEMMYTMLSKTLDPGKHYTMERIFAPEMTERKVHVNSFLIKHGVYWAVNGYDLDLNPIGGGGYGGDNQFLRQVAALAPRAHLSDVVLVGYGRRERSGRPVIKDADTQGDRDLWHCKYVDALKRKKDKGDMRSVRPIRTSYTRIL